MTQTQKKPKRGRPPLPSGKRRGASMGFRPTPKIREKLEEASRTNGRSMSQEVEERLGQSFKEDEVLGGMRLRALLILYGTAAQLVEQETGKSLFEDWNTWMQVSGAWRLLGGSFGPPEPKGWRKALNEASDAIARFALSEPPPEDAEQDARTDYLLLDVKRLRAINDFTDYQGDDRAQQAIGEEIVMSLLAEIPKKESRMIREQTGENAPEGETV